MLTYSIERRSVSSPHPTMVAGAGAKLKGLPMEAAEARPNAQARETTTDERRIMLEWCGW